MKLNQKQFFKVLNWQSLNARRKCEKGIFYMFKVRSNKYPERTTTVMFQ